MAFLQSGISSGAGAVMNYVLRSGLHFGAKILAIFVDNLHFIFVCSIGAFKTIFELYKRRGLLFIGLLCSVISPLVNGVVCIWLKQEKSLFETSRLLMFIIAGSIESFTLFHS